MRTLFLHQRDDRFKSSTTVRLRAFAMRSIGHLKRWGLAYLVIAAAALWFQARYTLGVNASPSLPYRVFLIHKGEHPERGDYVAFRWAGGGPYPAGVTFIKVLAGVPGDEVMRDAQGFRVNGKLVGAPKPFARAGQPLEPGPTGRIPRDRFYVQATHPDSLDSRYALTGWIHASQVIGRVDALF